jgi:hypothetical protein
MRKRLLSGLLVLLLFSVGCQDLAVENKNNPDTLRALAEPQDVETLIKDSWAVYFEAVEGCSTAFVLSVSADAHSCSWGNWGMNDMGAEPRRSWPNETTYRYQADVIQPFWYGLYTAISNSIDGLKAVNADPDKFTRAGIDVNRLKAFAKFVQGVSFSALALQLDQAFVLDETVDLATTELVLVPYTEVAEYAIGKLQEAIDIASANTFSIGVEEEWIYGNATSNEDLVKMAKTYQALTLAYLARTPADRAAAPWGQILTLLNAGVDELTPVGDDDGFFEWKCSSYYGADPVTWNRADYRTIGPADESVCDPNDGKINCYAEWLAAPLTERLVWDLTTSDRRIVGSATDPTVSGTLYEYRPGNGPFPAARGTYHFSQHAAKHNWEYLYGGANGPMTVVHETEVRMLKAEALLRTGGSLDQVADLINVSRVNNGMMNPASAADGAGSSTDVQSNLDSASLWAKLKHEKRIEVMLQGNGVEFYDDRGWGDLVSGTLVQFPVPAKELETIQVASYTFGGGGPGSAPKAQYGVRTDRDRFAKKPL